MSIIFAQEPKWNNKIDLHHLRACQAKRAYLYYLNAIRDPAFKAQLIRELEVRFASNGRELHHNQIDGIYYLRGPQPQVCAGTQPARRVQPTGSDGRECIPSVPLASGCHGLQLHSGNLTLKTIAAWSNKVEKLFLDFSLTIHYTKCVNSFFLLPIRQSVSSFAA